MATISIESTQEKARQLLNSRIESVTALVQARQRIAERTMPELHWIYGYPLALALMVAMGVALYATFRHNKWI